MKDIIAFKFGNQLIDTQSATDEISKNGEAIFFDNSPEALEVIRHSAAHLMAQAIKELYPDAKFFVGPVVEEGFYYDFKTSTKIGEEDLKAIEKKMAQLAKKGYSIEKYTISKDEAVSKFSGDELKQLVLSNIPSDEVSIYRQGEFEDLCRGPHLPNTKYLKFVKLTKIAGAYLGGDENSEMLTRIYGVAFATKEALKEHLHMLEEAEKRDHRKIGNQMGLFFFDDKVGAGLPIWLPAGGRLRAKLESYLFKAHRKRGYQPVRGPELLKSDLWKLSGHYQNYGENIYFTSIDEQEYGIKPMNCLGHIKIFQHSLHSYRDLPLKFFEYGVVHRHEKSGVLHGLFRVREFTQDDAHIFCREDQIKSEVIEVLNFVDTIMKIFDFEYSLEISTRPEKYIGSDEIWETATQSLKEALLENGIQFDIDEGGGAFYGPKIDIKIRDSIGRKWQCGTIQVDFNLPERFDITYIDEENKRVRPVMIHRAILGSFERFIGILTEHYAGEFPFFLAPTQIVIIPIKEGHQPYAQELAKKLVDMEVDVEIYDQNESLNKRIRTAEKSRVPMIVVLGDREVENRTIALRDRRERTKSNITEKEFLELIKEKLDEVEF
ncbi:MAG TPA: threonine--tRNA ligase [Campylobacterales bacterium]|nr:threonine--tRNA ligase [Campylobacterales bacterium]HIO71103.1 threonine--tRNA ligase [Campylobacterales bacterium]